MNKQRVVILLRGTGDQRDGRNRAMREAAERYAHARWGRDVELLDQQTGMPLLDAGGELGHLLRSLAPGTIAVVPSLSALSDTPSDLLRGVPAVLGAGIALHSCDIGPVSAQLEGLRLAWAQGEAVERELAKEREARADERRHMATMFEDYQRDFAASFVKAHGVPATGIQPLEVPDEIVAKFPIYASYRARAEIAKAERRAMVLGAAFAESMATDGGADAPAA